MRQIAHPGRPAAPGSDLMDSVCVRCHQHVAEGAVCCAELRHTWKCRRCGERTTGFVAPYGRCFLCGGDVETLGTPDAGDPALAGAVQEALQFEVDMLQFYRLGRAHARDPRQRALFDDLARLERGHIEELERKYHVHLDPRVLDMVFEAEQALAGWLFDGIDLEVAEGSLRPLYQRALAMERRTRDHFARRAAELPPGEERDICLELAAEEDEHVALLEREMERLDAAQGEAPGAARNAGPP